MPKRPDIAYSIKELARDPKEQDFKEPQAFTTIHERRLDSWSFSIVNVGCWQSSPQNSLQHMVMIKVAAYVGDVQATTIVIKVAAHDDDDDNDDTQYSIVSIHCRRVRDLRGRWRLGNNQRRRQGRNYRRGRSWMHHSVQCLRVSPCNLGRIRGAAHRY